MSLPPPRTFGFRYLALMLKAEPPSGELQAHLHRLYYLCVFCPLILSLYLPWDGTEAPHPYQTPAGPKTEEEPEPDPNPAGWAGVRVGNALLSGFVSIHPVGNHHLGCKYLGPLAQLRGIEKNKPPMFMLAEIPGELLPPLYQDSQKQGAKPRRKNRLKQSVTSDTGDTVISSSFSQLMLSETA